MWCEIGGTRVGIAHPLFVVAELGLNHGGSPERALRLVDAAAKAGASAVKLQTLFADELVAEGGAALDHVGQTSLREFFRTFELDEEAHRLVARRARARGLAFMATPFSLAAVDMLERVGVDAYKIASGDLTFLPLIERCAATGKPLVMSTGLSSLSEVRVALQTARLGGARHVVLLHCVSAYPVPAGSENLRAIATLDRSFHTPVGLSDHAPNLSSIPVAVALGASMYERHVTLPGDEGVDRAVSSLPDELAEAIREAERTRASLGHGRRECLPAEAGNRYGSRRSLHATRPIQVGERISAEDVVALRPAGGLPPSCGTALVGTRATRTIAAGAMFHERDLQHGSSRRDAA